MSSPMYTWEFLSNGGSNITVTATTEEQARTVAMTKLYGPPTSSSRNMGRGLMLQHQSLVEAKKVKAKS